jgi:hypothetical protein
MGLPYVYLGYWVAESRKMAYKTRFQPCEILSAGAWRVMAEPAATAVAAADDPTFSEVVSSILPAESATR